MRLNQYNIFIILLSEEILIQFLWCAAVIQHTHFRSTDLRPGLEIHSNLESNRCNHGWHQGRYRLRQCARHYLCNRVPHQVRHQTTHWARMKHDYKQTKYSQQKVTQRVIFANWFFLLSCSDICGSSRDLRKCRLAQISEIGCPGAIGSKIGSRAGCGTMWYVRDGTTKVGFR